MRRVERVLMFCAGVLCGWGLAKGWGPWLGVVGVAMYALGSLRPSYER